MEEPRTCQQVLAVTQLELLPPFPEGAAPGPGPQPWHPHSLRGYQGSCGPC